MFACTCLLSFVCAKECAGVFCRLMAHVNKNARPVDSLEVVDSTLDATVSFEFGLSRVTSSDLDEFVKAGWFGWDLVRLPKGEVVPNPWDDEVVIYKEFFLVGLRFLAHPLVVGVLKRFNLKFHQLNPSSFVKLSIYVWGYKSHGVEPDLEGFV